jgi:hypothetical protein
MAGITQNQPPGVASQGQPAVADEAVRICSDLIGTGATNPGDHSGPGEPAAAIGPARPLNRWHAQQTHARQAIRSASCYKQEGQPPQLAQPRSVDDRVRPYQAALRAPEPRLSATLRDELAASGQFH